MKPAGTGQPGIDERLRNQMDRLLEGMQIIDFEWNYLFINDVLAFQLGMPKSRLERQKITDVFPGIDSLPFFKYLTDCMENRRVVEFENQFFFEDGSSKWFQVKAEPVEEGISVLTLDVSLYKETLANNTRIKNLYSVLRQINQSIVHLKSEGRLFAKACSIAVTDGRFKKAWIGVFDSGNKTGIKVSAMASATDVSHSIPNALRTDSGEMQRVVRETGSAFIIDPSNKDQHQETAEVIEKAGMKSAISLPLRKNGKIYGTFNLYSDEENFIGTDEIDLLLEVSGDLSFAIDIFEKNKKHKHTEKLVTENERRFRAIIEKSKDMKTMTDAEGNLLYGSPSITEILGYVKEDFQLMTVCDLIHEDDRDDYMTARENLKSRPMDFFHFELRLKHKLNGYLWCEGTSTNLLLEPGVNAIVSNFRDISDRKEIEDQLEFDRQNMKALINNTNDLQWSVDLEGRLIIANRRFDEYVEKTYRNKLLPGDLVVHPFLTEENRVLYEGLYTRALQGESFSAIAPSSIPGKWSELSFYPIKDKDKIIGTACNARDITPWLDLQKNLKDTIQELTDYQYALDESSIVSITDQYGNITRVNDNFCLISGYSREELIGKDHRMMKSGFHPPSFIARLYKTLSEGHPWRGEFKNRRKDGSYFWVDMTVVPFLDENSKAYQYIAIQSDITLRRFAEEELQKNLEELQRTNAELDRFVYSISHDLRSPITSIRGLISLIKDESEENSTLQHTNMIADRVDRLDNFIKNVLNYSRIKRSEMEPQEFHPGEITREIIDSLSGVKAMNDIRFDVNIKMHCPFATDRQSFSTIMENLISNAIKFQDQSKRSKKVSIIGVADASGLQLQVADNGISIEEKHQSQIFNMFFRIAGTTEGTGIGLYIVKQTVEKLGGRVDVESEPGEGTTIIVHLKNFNQSKTSYDQQSDHYH